MDSITDYMEADHRRCDELFADAENAASEGNWGVGESCFQAFVDAIEHHFAMEEGTLFPSFEEATGNAMGPTQVMRHEHEQMRELFRSMGEAAGAHDADAFLGDAETLLILMQQHNRKEEQILYPMSDQVFSGNSGEVLGRMKATKGE